MSELKYQDFLEMVSASHTIGDQLGISTEDTNVQLEDEDGNIHGIVDVKFNMATRSIHILFNHDE